MFKFMNGFQKFRDAAKAHGKIFTNDFYIYYFYQAMGCEITMSPWDQDWFTNDQGDWFISDQEEWHFIPWQSHP